MLEKVLEDTYNVSVPWVISPADLIPQKAILSPPVRFGRGSTLSKASGSVLNAPATALGGAPDAPSRLVGASGPLPSELAAGGRWFARTVGEKTVLLTFLPALDVWKNEVSVRLERRKERRQQWAERRAMAAVEQSDAARRQQGSGRASEARARAAEAKAAEAQAEAAEAREEKKDGDHSLGLFLFLVRSGDFGLPIEAQTEKLRDARRILLAHIPRSHHGAMAFKPRQR